MRSSYNFMIRVTLMFSMIFKQTLQRVTWFMRDLGVWMVDFGVGRMDRVHLLKDVVGDKLNVLQIVCVIQLGKLCHFGGILDQFKGMYGKMLKYND